MSKPNFIGANTLSPEAKGFRVQVFMPDGNVQHTRIKRLVELRMMLEDHVNVAEELKNGAVLLVACDQNDYSKPRNKHFEQYRGVICTMDRSDFKRLRN